MDKSKKPNKVYKLKDRPAFEQLTIIYHTLVRPCSEPEVRAMTGIPTDRPVTGLPCPNPHLSVLTPAFSGLRLLFERTTSNVSQSGEALTKYNLRNIFIRFNF